MCATAYARGGRGQAQQEDGQRPNAGLKAGTAESRRTYFSRVDLQATRRPEFCETAGPDLRAAFLLGLKALSRPGSVNPSLAYRASRSCPCTGAACSRVLENVSG